MLHLPGLIRFCRRVLQRQSTEKDLDDEVRSFAGMLVDEKIAAGTDAAEAERTAGIELGGLEQVKEQIREARVGFWLETLGKDFKYSIRSLLGDRTFALIAILTLSLGVGANSAVFNIMRTLLFRSLSVPHPDQLVRIALDFSGAEAPLTGPMFDELQKRMDAMPEVMAWAPYEMYLQENDSSQPTDGALISGNGFPLLHLKAEIGRLLTPRDDAHGGGQSGFAAVLSDRFWRSNYGARASVLNRRLVVNGIPVTVVGVMPAKFDGMLVGSSPDVVLPLEFEVRSGGIYSQRHFAGSTWLNVFGRRRNDVSFGTAAAQLQFVAPSVLRKSLDSLPAPVQKDLLPRLKLRLYPGRNGGSEQVGHAGESLRDLYRRPLFATQWLGCFLLVMCVLNLTALQFARSTARRHEFAIRVSLGASHSRILMQLAMESALLGAITGLIALVVGSIADSALRIFLANQRENWLTRPTPDSMVVGGVFAAALGCMMFSALLPFVFRRWSDPAGILRLNRSSTGRSASSLSFQRVLIPLQVSLCTILLVAASLFLSTLSRLLNVPLGFNPQNVLLFPFHGGSDGKPAEQKAIEMKILDRLRSMPGVSAATFLDVQPIGGGPATTTIEPKEFPRIVDRQAAINGVGPGYLAVMGTRLMQGRDFRSTDTPQSPPVCMVSMSAAQYFFQGSSPLEKHLILPEPRAPSAPAECEVVGVTEDAKYNDLRASPPRLVYDNAAQSGYPVGYIAVRTSVIHQAILEFNRIVHQENPSARVTNPELLTNDIRSTVGRERLVAATASFFGVLSLIATGVGLYGFLSWSVARRTREIGIRMALGARPGQVAWMISHEALVLMVTGICFGGTAAFLLTKLVTSMLYATSALDGSVAGSTILIMLLLGIGATWIPGQHATHIQPSSALRSE